MKDKKILHDTFRDVPFLNQSPVSMENPNEHINVYSGDFSISLEEKTYNLNGEVYFSWFPRMGLKFTGRFIGKYPLIITEKYDLLIEGKKIGEFLITNLNDSNEPSCSGETKQFIWGDKSVSVNEVIFSIPNLREFLGDSVRERTQGEGISLHKARLVLEDRHYKIELDKLPDYTEREKKLRNEGGYLITYAGKITKRNGSISLSEIHDWNDRFHHFLYFINGRRVAPMFYTGVHEGEYIWTDYGSYVTDNYKEVDCWANIIFLDHLPQLWKAYNKLWKSESNKDFLITAIHWYVEANSSAGMIEGSIILIQTALELIYNWLIIERQKVIIGNDADNMSAANKIRMLIFQLKISPAIPPAFKKLGALPDVKDGPEAFVKIRNALVHGQETKRAELRKISFEAKYEALQLAIWYVELALLYILNYKGNYRNRTDGNIWRNTGTPVPWVNDQSFKFGIPSDFSDEEIEYFVELLEKQGKIDNPTEQKVLRCKLIAIGFSSGQPVSIGAIKPKTVSDFKPEKANLPQLEKEFEWEVGYFYTEQEHEGRGFSSTILNTLLKKYGNGKLMATTEIRNDNLMLAMLEKREFIQMGNTWKSIKSDNNLRLFLKGLENK